MQKNKPKIITVILIIMTIGLIGTIFYISIQLANPNVQKSAVVPKKTKAQATTYNKLIAINRNSNNSQSNSNYAQNNIPDTPAVSAEPTFAAAGIPTSALSPVPDPSPTETLLAVNNPAPTYSSTSLSPTISPSLIPSTTVAISPTKVKALPQSGVISNSLIIFAAAGLLVFFSFLY